MPDKNQPRAMSLPFTDKPGRRERHLRRQHDNPLFAWPSRQVAAEDLLAAQKADHEEMDVFRTSFAALVQKAVDLEPDASSDTVLRLKEELEIAYEQTCGLPEDHGKERGYIRQLIALIMKALWSRTSGDSMARAELGDEETARSIHYRLLEQPLIADILHPETPITSEELAPSVLDASAAEVDAVLEVLDPQQLAALVQQAAPLLERLDARGLPTDAPLARLRQITARLTGSGSNGAGFN